MVKYNTSIFIFTRDLRLHDNLPLYDALNNSDVVIPIFIFNPEQVGKQNKYKSNNCIQFMCESLEDLDMQLKKLNSKLFYFYNSPENVIKTLLKNNDIDAVYISKDYTPFAMQREKDIKKVCDDIDFVVLENHMLTGVDAVKKGDDTYYVKFTPYYNLAKTIKVNKPIGMKKNFIRKTKSFTNEYKKSLDNFYKYNENVEIVGGRENAVAILKHITEFKKYNVNRDYPMLNTTRLSAHLKFGTISVREFYHAIKLKLGPSNDLLKQLYWRDFYMMITYTHPHVLKGKPMKLDYNIKWINSKSKFDKWCSGQTGVPIVDAGMRELNMTGYMHNRTRMITSCFLIKILGIDWRAGEKYFAQNLVDYDPANNSGGWQYISSTSTESQPYFRYFNPWIQARKFDYDCIYIKKWIPELKDVPIKDILNWDTAYDQYKDLDYPKPMVDDVGEEFKKILKLYKSAIY